MKNRMSKLITSILVIFGGLFTAAPAVVTTPVYAASTGCRCEIKNADGSTSYEEGKTIDAAILKDVCDCGHGEGVIAILNLVVRILTVGVGILAAIGISVAGVQYLTAGGSEEQTRKAKRRIFEVVIGLFAYVLIYAVLSFLLPGFKPL